MAGASKGSFFLWRTKVLEKSAKSYSKAKKQYKIILKNYQNTNKKKKKEKKQTDKREKHIKSNGTGKTEQKDTQILAEKVSEGSMT